MKSFDGFDLFLAMFMTACITFMTTLGIVTEVNRKDLAQRGLIQYVIDSKTGAYGIQFLSEKDGVWAFHAKADKEDVKKD